jgi:hypothetical protein
MLRRAAFEDDVVDRLGKSRIANQFETQLVKLQVVVPVPQCNDLVRLERIDNGRYRIETNCRRRNSRRLGVDHARNSK